MSEADPPDIVIGVDTHKHTHAAVAVTEFGARLAELNIPVSTAGYQALEAWGRSGQQDGADRLGSDGAGDDLQDRGRGVSRGRPPGACEGEGAGWSSRLHRRVGGSLEKSRVSSPRIC